MHQLKAMLDEAIPLEHDRLAALLRQALDPVGAELEPELPAIDETRLATAVD